MKNHKQKKEAGFTLIEAVVVVAIFTLIAYGLIELVSSIIVSSSKQSALLTGSDQARKLAFQITTELREATPSSIGAYPLDTASGQQIIFYSNVDADSSIERVRYFLQGTTLKRGIVKPSGNPLSYNLAGETVTDVQNDVANGATDIFLYYDGSYNGVAGNPFTSPVSVIAVKYVKVNLKITNRGGIKNTNSYTVTAGAAFRNLKTNL